MVKVKVTSFFTLKDILGDCKVALSPDDCSVNALLKELVKIYGEKFSRHVLDPKTGEVKFYRVVLNNRQCTDFEAPLKDGDTIQFYPALAGG
jgi:molybdopterin converting factor small subunit